MDNPSDRRQGLPIPRAPVERVLKQGNRRVKGSEKCGLRGGVEAVLQVRAAYLSEDERAERYWSRPRGRGRSGAVAWVAADDSAATGMHPRSISSWTLTTLREKLVKIGAKVVTHARYVTFQLAEVAVPCQLFAAILNRIGRLRLGCASG